MDNAIAIHEAYCKGDMQALRNLLGDPLEFPNCQGPRGLGENILEYAIYWSPESFIRELLELGANPNYEDSAGFPSLIATLSTDRKDRIKILKLLLAHGADLQQRGVNGYTPLHYAATRDDAEAVGLLLERGADPNARTGIDEDNTPLELAEMLKCMGTAEILRRTMNASGKE